MQSTAENKPRRWHKSGVQRRPFRASPAWGASVTFSCPIESLAGCGKTRCKAGVDRARLQPRRTSPLFLSFREGFSPRGICCSALFAACLAPEGGRLKWKDQFMRPVLTWRGLRYFSSVSYSGCAGRTSPGTSAALTARIRTRSLLGSVNVFALAGMSMA